MNIIFWIDFIYTDFWKNSLIKALKVSENNPSQNSSNDSKNGKEGKSTHPVKMIVMGIIEVVIGFILNNAYHNRVVVPQEIQQ